MFQKTLERPESLRYALGVIEPVYAQDDLVVGRRRNRQLFHWAADPVVRHLLKYRRLNADLVGPEPRGNATESNRRKSYQQRGVSPEYEASKFVYDAATKTCVCPQGKHLRYDAKYELHGAMRYRYKASKQDCQTCPAKDQCCPRTKHGRSIERRVLLPDIAAFRKKMQTDEAKAIYKTRSQVAEFPNLWIKTKFGLRQFSVRGVAKVRTESQWVALTYDILQWIRLRWRPKMVSALAPT